MEGDSTTKDILVKCVSEMRRTRQIVSIVRAGRAQHKAVCVACFIGFLIQYRHENNRVLIRGEAGDRVSSDLLLTRFPRPSQPSECEVLLHALGKLGRERISKS